MPSIRVYNYPWAGHLGSIADRCLYCGDNGIHYQVSSRAGRCYGKECCERQHSGAKPIPELLTKYEADYERLAREWCVKHGMDYDTVVKELWEQHGGPPNQERKED